VALANKPPENTQPPEAPPVKKLASNGTDPVTVAIYDFRSNIQELPSRGATDMFVTALQQNGRFRVVERAQLNQDIAVEKQLNAQGSSTGTAASKQLHGADYIFEGAVTEANAGESANSSAVGVAGMSVSGGKNQDVIAIDVRIVDAGTGDVLDAVSVHKNVKSKAAGVSGVGNLLGSVLARHGADTTYTPDVNVQQQHKDSLDAALRAAIDDAVTQLAARF
jgi:curli biogenesis system outer membrane secretion channel CsgG